MASEPRGKYLMAAASFVFHTFFAHNSVKNIMEMGRHCNTTTLILSFSNTANLGKIRIKDLRV